MSWMHYDVEKGINELCGILPSEINSFTVIMEENTWYNVIRKPGEHTERVNKFLNGLKVLLEMWDEKEPDLLFEHLYILHIDLQDENTALVSLQRKHGYEFVFKNVPISFA